MTYQVLPRTPLITLARMGSAWQIKYFIEIFYPLKVYGLISSLPAKQIRDDANFFNFAYLRNLFRGTEPLIYIPFYSFYGILDGFHCFEKRFNNKEHKGAKNNTWNRSQDKATQSTSEEQYFQKPASSSYCKRSIDTVDRTPSIPRKATQSAFEERYFQNHLLPVLTSNEA